MKKKNTNVHSKKCPETSNTYLKESENPNLKKTEDKCLVLNI